MLRYISTFAPTAAAAVASAAAVVFLPLAICVSSFGAGVVASEAPAPGPAVASVPASAADTPADAADTPAAAAAAFDAYLADFRACPGAFQAACLRELEVIEQFLKELPAVGDDDTEDAYRDYVMKEVEMRLLGEESYLQFDLPPLYMAYIKERVELTRGLYALCLSDVPLATILKAMRVTHEDLLQVHLKPCYSSILSSLEALPAICHFCAIDNEQQNYYSLPENHEPKGFLQRCYKKQLDFNQTALAVLRGQLDLKVQDLPITAFSVPELNRVRERMMTLVTNEWYCYHQIDALTDEHFILDFMRGDAQRKAFIFAYFAAEFRCVADSCEYPKDAAFDPGASYLRHMMALSPSEDAYAAFWEAMIHYKSLVRSGKASSADKAAFEALCAQQPEAVRYFDFVNLDSTPFRALYMPADGLTDYCKEELAAAKKPLADPSVNKAVYIHYQSQKAYFRALARFFDEFADLYRRLAR